MKISNPLSLTARQVREQAVLVSGHTDFAAMAAEKIAASLERRGRTDAANRLRQRALQERQGRNFKTTGK